MRLDVAGEVFADVVLVPHQPFEIEGEVLSKSCYDFFSRNGSGLIFAASRFAFSASTAGLVDSSTQSSRRSTVNGRMTRPNSERLYSHRNRSATDQMKEDRLV